MDWKSLWQALQPYAASRLKNVLVTGAVWLVAHKVIPAEQQSAFVEVTFSLASYVGMEAASWFATREIPRLEARIAELEKRHTPPPVKS